METEKVFKHKVEIEMTASYKPNGTIRIMWIRLFLAIISMLIMFTDISYGSAFFRTLIIFSLSQFLFVIGLESDKRWKAKLNQCIEVVLGCACVISLLGWANVLTLAGEEESRYFLFSKTSPLRGVEVSTDLLFWGLSIALLLLYTIQIVNSMEKPIKNVTTIGGE